MTRLTKYRVQLDRVTCIGAGACAAVNPEFWEMVADGKVDIKNGTRNADNSWHEIEIEDKDLETNMEAAKVCPVNAIIIHNKETGEKLWPK